MGPGQGGCGRPRILASGTAGHGYGIPDCSLLPPAGSVHPPSTSMATSSQYRQLLSDYGPPSLGYTQVWRQGGGSPAMPRQAILSQEEKRARARERDRLKKRRRREDGLKRSLERQRNALAMRRWREQRKEECGATRRRRQEAEDLDQEKRKDLETKQQRQQRRREEQSLLLDWIPLPDRVPLLDRVPLPDRVRRMIPAPASSLPGIIHARGLVRECLAETERNARS
ncbi:cyclin-dependent kinase 2-associated protein 1 [Myotis lucifugus]|uniref:cyclin-dependent kinase 2-associated protein 1 n=1 Tax=Myotis lucifugus TaxID=59463 RepID=UPI000CCC4D21|nr:cyclin-dependent kinase 2-associated protein 1 [Myotis lucifugus]